MGRGGRVDNQAFDVGDIGKQGKNLQMVDKGMGFLLPTLNLKGEDRSAAIGEIFLI